MLINWQCNNKDGIGCKFLFEICMFLVQCTYLGYLLLEAPREYVQHGPLLSINWLRLCPQSGARVRSHRPEEVVYSLNDSCSHLYQRLFPPKLPRQHTCTIFIIHSPSFILIIHHIQASIYILLLHDKSLFHFFGSSWQAGCSRSLVSDTLIISNCRFLKTLTNENLFLPISLVFLVSYWLNMLLSRFPEVRGGSPRCLTFHFPYRLQERCASVVVMKL
jgi:hypothetical protein